MRTALIISGSPKGLSSLEGLLSAHGFSRIDTALSAAEARICVTSNGYDFIVINTPLTDSFGDKLAVELFAENPCCQVVLTVKEDLFDTVSAAMTQKGIYTLQKPLSKIQFDQTIAVAKAVHARLTALYGQQTLHEHEMQEKLDDVRLISRAKIVLISYLKISEAEAHRYIEKQAMDLRISRRSVAENILVTYES